jgi:hypothetical protein
MNPLEALPVRDDCTSWRTQSPAITLYQEWHNERGTYHGVWASAIPVYAFTQASTLRLCSVLGFAVHINSETIPADLYQRAVHMVKEWAQIYQRDLIEMWNTQQFKQLPGLE